MYGSRAVYIRRKYGNKQLSSSIYLSEAEPFLEQYAKRSAENQALIGSAGNLVQAEDFLAIVGGRDEEGDLEAEREAAPPSPIPSTRDSVLKDEGLIVFFPGMWDASLLIFLYITLMSIPNFQLCCQTSIFIKCSHLMIGENFYLAYYEEKILVLKLSVSE